MTFRSVALLTVCSSALTASVLASSDAPAQVASPADTQAVAPPPAPVEQAQSADTNAYGVAKEQSNQTTAPSVTPAPAVEPPHPEMETNLAKADTSNLGIGSTPATATQEEIVSLLRIGQTKRDQGDYASAEIAFMQVLAVNATTEQDREALLGLGRTYRKKGDFTKASAIYERFIKSFPADPELPSVYLELGRTMRALGAYKQAINRFYSVLNSTLKLPDQGAEVYRQLARTAQFEIAETYFQLGDYEQATRFFSRLKLLDLAPEDRARAHFKSVFALTLAGENDKAVVGLKSFLEQYPEDENVPEARYLLSVALRRMGRSQESLHATLDLLKIEAARTKQDAKRWAYWQRKTGNQLANEFYQSGDITSALLVYQSLAALSNDPAWHLPAKYQIGLCHERLRRYDRARECYQTIVDNLKASGGNSTPRPDLADLAEMAAWRLSQLNWYTTTESQLSAIFTPGSAPAEQPSPPSGPASASAHDHNGSAPIASNAVR
jgi:tetratricopeptide (TPR) repeat protein